MTTGAHRPWFHAPLIVICKHPPEAGDCVVAGELDGRPRKTFGYRKPNEALLELINASDRSESVDRLKDD